MFTGVVVTGLGEGAMYVEKYNTYFAETLGKTFFFGTLNIQTDYTVQLAHGIAVQPTEPDLQEVHCYPARLNNTAVYIVVPTIRKHADNIIEFLAEENLRETLNIKDGDEVTCELQ